jgi:hypothetical protein|tara:strand:+ start:325 stop:564 length:240 start_codon:yes stop_codon:yes gene_type:complete
MIFDGGLLIDNPKWIKEIKTREERERTGKIDLAIEKYGSEKVKAATEAVTMTDIDSALSVFEEAGMPEYKEVIEYIYLL